MSDNQKKWEKELDKKLKKVTKEELVERIRLIAEAPELARQRQVSWRQKQVTREFEALIRDEYRAYDNYIRLAEEARNAGMASPTALFERIAADKKEHNKLLINEAQSLGMVTKYWGFEVK